MERCKRTERVKMCSIAHTVGHIDGSWNRTQTKRFVVLLSLSFSLVYCRCRSVRCRLPKRTHFCIDPFSFCFLLFFSIFYYCFSSVWRLSFRCCWARFVCLRATAAQQSMRTEHLSNVVFNYFGFYYYFRLVIYDRPNNNNCFRLSFKFTCINFHQCLLTNSPLSSQLRLAHCALCMCPGSNL